MAASGKSSSSGGSKRKPKAGAGRSSKPAGRAAGSGAGAKKSTSRAAGGKAGSEGKSNATQGSSAGAETPVADFDRPYLWRAFVRLVAMLLYGIIGYAVLLLYFVLAAVQFAIDFVAGRPNAEISEFMSRLRAYLGELLAYLGFQRDAEDFPFPYPGSPFPGPADEQA